MSLNPIYSVTDFNKALDTIFSRTSSTPNQREAISKELEFLQEHLDFLVYHGTEIQVTDLNACQMRLVQVRSAFERGILSLTPSTALTLTNRPEPDLSPLPFPDESMLFIFSRAVGNPSTSKLLGILSLVCKEWRRVASDNIFWKPVFQRCLEKLTYDISDSSAATLKEKIKLLNNTNLKDFKKIIKELDDKNNTLEKKVTRLGFKSFLNEYDLTDLIERLISKEELEPVAKLLLFKPKINASIICTKLRHCTKLPQNIDLNTPNAPLANKSSSYNFLLQLMIKLKYDVSDAYFIKGDFYFRNDVPAEPLLKEFIFSPMHNPILKVTDFMANRWLFTPPKFEISNRMLLSIAETHSTPFYHTGQFQALQIPLPPEVPFSDEKLQKYIRKSPFSEEDLKELILDLLTKVGFDLDEIYPQNGLLNEGSLLSQFRQQVDVLPKPNAFSQALAEYDQMQAEKL